MSIPTATAITAVTAQGVDGVVGIQLTSPDLLAKQINEAFRSYPISGVKIGMLGSSQLVQVVADALRRHKPETIVLDPVLSSTSGTPLLDEAGIRVLLEELMPLATLITPNVPEAEILTGITISSDEDLARAGEILLQRGARAVLLKGGHLPADPIDTLFLPGEAPIDFKARRFKTDHSRGTGCILASGILGLLILKCSIQDAVERAKNSIADSLRQGVVPVLGPGYPSLMWRDLTRADRNWRLAALSGLYFVSDSKLNPRISHAMGARLAMAGGAKIVQLRDKEYETSHLVRLARTMRDAARAHGAIFIQNDRVDVARAADADGVHLGPDDMNVEDAREILGHDRLIGVSASTVEEANRLAQYASYIAVGAIFGSSTKGDAGDPVGVDRIAEIKREFPDKKIVAIGGINLSNIASVAAAGADAAAVVSAIVCAPDPEQATRELLAEFERGKATRAALQ